MIGFSADGDTRLLSAMKSITLFDLKPDIDLIKRENINPVCVQDSIHIGTKLRNRLLNSSIVLRIGDQVATIVHIKMLLNSVAKEVHGLVQSDIYPEDRQNFRSLEKIMDSRVIRALDNHIPDCKATIMYLKLCKQITSSFVQEDLQPIERIYQIWNALYFLRCWRKWLQASKTRTGNYTLAENFISCNAFTCIEINAHSMIGIIVKLRSTPNMFLPPIFASQPCEEMFRQMRSMGTANYTKINFSLNELLHLIARVEMLNKIAYSSNDIVFPRIQLSSENKFPINLPSDDGIFNAMERALKDAVQQANQFGIQINSTDITESTVQVSNDNLLDDIMREEEDLLDGIERIVPDDNNAELSRNIEVIDSDGSTKSIPKSTLIWMLSESNGKLSSDRLKRVQGSTTSTSKRMKLDLSRNVDERPCLFKSNQLQIGEWAIFCLENDNLDHNTSEQILLDNYLIGVAIGFSILKNGHRRQYKHDHVSITSESHTDDIIQVLGVWYTFDENQILHRKRDQNTFTVNIGKYFATMKNPTTEKDENCENISYFLPCKYNELKEMIFELHSNNEINATAQ